MMIRYILVIKSQKEDYMMVLKTEENVIAHVSCLEKHQEMERLFSVNEFGDVRHKEIVFKGRLKIVDKFPSLPNEDVF